MENNLENAIGFLTKAGINGKFERTDVGQYNVAFDIPDLANKLVAYAAQVQDEANKRIAELEIEMEYLKLR